MEDLVSLALLISEILALIQTDVTQSARLLMLIQNILYILYMYVYRVQNVCALAYLVPVGEKLSFSLRNCLLHDQRL